MRYTTLALLAALAVPVQAAGNEETIARLDPAWKSLESRVGRLLGATGQRTLLDMAYAQVAVDACPGLTLDHPAYEASFARLASGPHADAAARRRFENEMMADFGVYTGLLLAESFLDKPAFCRAVEENRTRGSTGPARFWRPAR